MAKRISWRIVLIVLFVLSSIGAFEAHAIYRCHTTISECWPWFFIFTLTLPASIGSSHLAGLAMDRLPFGPGLFASFVVYVSIGTLWWSLLLHGLRFLLTWRTRRNPSDSA
ncbi:MAG: hypothetical protein QM719_11390 [Thermomonas sp.]